ncbi:ArgE/DapE family deacylase [Salicibibacter cibarius]|uniref:ArgE/DapE family deacylase n=1 Tax=Salicibibacter cibarius TaxID=2743000 RepID=A0A7T7CD24_9BACI|nr:ArgE/DapE family deacylase [Salicibibacter cibarius]QQK77525.1 ArgE/DapE family deacylase [Salicibibacter cibarius]
MDTIIPNPISQKIDELWTEEIVFLQEISRFPSVSGKEKALQAYIADYLISELNMDVDRFTPDIKEIANHPGFSPPEWGYEESDVVIAKQAGPTTPIGKSLIFQGHVDVVSPEPTSLWSSDPWVPIFRDGKMYGRGVADMKAGITAMIFAYKAIISAGYKPGADFMIQSVVDEERTGNGALATLNKGYTADGALIPEPFGLKAAKAQVGSLWFRINIDTALKDKNINQVVNAVERSQLIISALQEYEKLMNERPKHDAFKDMPHPVDINIGRFHAGDFPSNVPVKAVMEGRVGLYPGQSINAVKKELREWVLEAADEDPWLSKQPPEITFFGFHAEGVEMDDQSPFFKTLDDAHETVLQQPAERNVLSSTTDARFFNLYYDTPATCYGPEGGNFHEIDEWVDLDSVKQVTKVYAEFLSQWCGLIPRHS